MHLISTSSVNGSLCSIDETMDKWVTKLSLPNQMANRIWPPGLKLIDSCSIGCRYKGGPILFFTNYSVKFAIGVWEWEWSKPHIFYLEKATYSVSSKVTTKLLQMWILQSKIHTNFWRFSVKCKKKNTSFYINCILNW